MFLEPGTSLLLPITDQFRNSLSRGPFFIPSKVDLRCLWCLLLRNIGRAAESARYLNPRGALLLAALGKVVEQVERKAVRALRAFLNGRRESRRG